MSDGKECKCCARSEHECSCGADWTPKEVIELREALRVAVVGHRCWTLQWAISEHRTSIEDAREAARKLGYDGTCEVREWLESRIELMENVANPLLARMLKETT